MHEDSIMKTIYHPVEVHSGFSHADMIGLPPGEEQVLDRPFLPPRSEEDLKAKPYTLVLDLDETLGHYVKLYPLHLVRRLNNIKTTKKGLR